MFNTSNKMIATNNIRTGMVKFWHDKKKYAFIIDDDNGRIPTGTMTGADGITYGCVLGNETAKEFYTYKRFLADTGSRLFNGEKVQYELVETTKGIHAINVKSKQ